MFFWNYQIIFEKNQKIFSLPYIIKDIGKNCGRIALLTLNYIL